jgi:hypothetical protein
VLEGKQDMNNEDVQPKLSRPTSSMRRLGIPAAVLVAVFLLGFIPMWLKARGCANSLAGAEHQLVLLRMQNSLASATIEARRGDYEPARQAASQFFTTLRAEVDKQAGSNFTQAQRDGAQTLFAGRDEIITLLARSDPAAADRLSDLYVSYRKIMNGAGGSP